MVNISQFAEADIAKVFTGTTKENYELAKQFSHYATSTTPQRRAFWKALRSPQGFSTVDQMAPGSRLRAHIIVAINRHGDGLSTFRAFRDFFEIKLAEEAGIPHVSSAGSTGCCGLWMNYFSSVPEGSEELKWSKEFQDSLSLPYMAPKRGDQHGTGNGRLMILETAQATRFRAALIKCGMNETVFDGFSTFFYEEQTKTQATKQPWGYSFSTEPCKGEHERPRTISRYVHKTSHASLTSEMLTSFNGYEDGHNIHKIAKTPSIMIQTIVLRDKLGSTQIKNNYLAAVAAGFVAVTPDGQPYKNSVYGGDGETLWDEEESRRDYLESEVHWLLPMVRRNPHFEQDR